jgi:hypothetical protein
MGPIWSVISASGTSTKPVINRDVIDYSRFVTHPFTFWKFADYGNPKETLIVTDGPVSIHPR